MQRAESFWQVKKLAKVAANREVNMVSRLDGDYFGRVTVQESTADAVGLARLAPATPVQRICWQVPARLARGGLPVNSLEFLGVRDHFGNLRIMPKDAGMPAS